VPLRLCGKKGFRCKAAENLLYKKYNNSSDFEVMETLPEKL
jgi:hypothetical protein